MANCKCGAELEGDGWTEDRLCQTCWEKLCANEFWSRMENDVQQDN